MVAKCLIGLTIGNAGKGYIGCWNLGVRVELKHGYFMVWFHYVLNGLLMQNKS
jgi:hypothetical protein